MLHSNKIYLPITIFQYIDPRNMLGINRYGTIKGEKNKKRKKRKEKNRRAVWSNVKNRMS